ncbi:hypothetical protein M9H77_08044 [Catharanthus roseus]|uniref:Uncharacterized protein n=1 Tax=Catharanthus roseus TaxID=4058 RepID=A0ACC0BWV2_CATRO|nr:hypothetical protein M9H77_08044 [Catharanthus roseus]
MKGVFISYHSGVKVIRYGSEPSEHTLIPHTNGETNNPGTVPENNVPESENSDVDEEHRKAQAHALNDYQLTRDREMRVSRELVSHLLPRVVAFLFPSLRLPTSFVVPFVGCPPFSRQLYLD